MKLHANAKLGRLTGSHASEGVARGPDASPADGEYQRLAVPGSLARELLVGR